MQLPSARPQTLIGAVGYFVFATIMFGFLWGLTRDSRGDPLEIVQGILTGASFGTLKIAWDYFRLEPKDRLAPVHALGLGLLNIGLLAWMLATRKDPVMLEWKTLTLALVLALPPIALIAAGTRQWRRETQASRGRSDGT